MLNYRTSVLEELCASLKNNLNHACERCMDSKDAEAISQYMQDSMCLDEKKEKAETSTKYMDMCLEEEEKKP